MRFRSTTFRHALFSALLFFARLRVVTWNAQALTVRSVMYALFRPTKSSSLSHTHNVISNGRCTYCARCTHWLFSEYLLCCLGWERSSIPRP